MQNIFNGKRNTLLYISKINTDTQEKNSGAMCSAKNAKSISHGFYCLLYLIHTFIKIFCERIALLKKTKYIRSSSEQYVKSSMQINKTM